MMLAGPDRGTGRGGSGLELLAAHAQFSTTGSWLPKEGQIMNLLNQVRNF